MALGSNRASAKHPLVVCFGCILRIWPLLSLGIARARWEPFGMDREKHNGASLRPVLWAPAGFQSGGPCNAWEIKWDVWWHVLGGPYTPRGRDSWPNPQPL